jgi:AraC family transcriptional regulator
MAREFLMAESRAEGNDGSEPTGYFDQHGAKIDAGARLVGIEQGWSAPIAFIHAAEGFGEQVWVPGCPENVLSIWLSGARTSCRWGPSAGKSTEHFAYTLQPRGVPNHFEAKGAVSFAQIFLPDALLDSVADGLRPGAGISGSLRDDVIFKADRELNARLAMYLRAARTGADVSRVEIDARAILITERLLALHHGLGAAAPAEPRGLAAWQLKRVRAFLEQASHQRVTLAELAGVARLSPFHFARAFRAATGVPPHRYQMRLRIERAKALLAGSDKPVGDVAAEVGYANQSYFARLFQAEVGTTPARYRRERRK